MDFVSSTLCSSNKEALFSCTMVDDDECVYYYCKWLLDWVLLGLSNSNEFSSTNFEAW